MNWLRQHCTALAGAFSHLWRSPGNFILNVLVVSIALALPFAGLTVLENVRPISEQLAVEPEISIFLKMDLPREKATALSASISKILQSSGGSAKVIFTPREQALGALKSKTGLSDVLATLGTNPLPDSYVLKISGLQSAMDSSSVDDIARQLKAMPGVDTVQIDSAWIRQLAALLHILRLVLLFLGITLGAIVIAVVFNTIRLQIMTQHEEIDISRLLGATNAFIHRPFYYTGVLLGLCAGGLALIWVMLALQPLNTAIADFARLYASEFRLAPASFSVIGFLLGLSALLGLAGAMLSVRRHLSRLA
ncbi:MAG: permease-like cell division protein FtsX [Herbaspirillum sp.]